MAIQSVSKPKPANGFSYVLKTSQLAEALSNAGIDCHADLIYRTPRGGGSILEAYYWLPTPNISYPRLYIRAGVVKSALRVAAAESLAAMGLPLFIKWLREILALPDDSTALTGTLYFNAAYTEEGQRVTYQPVYMVRRRGH